MAIPFATELRCLLDFTFSKTALDIFQFWQLFQYHIELYCAKNGNISYVKKVLGSKTPMFDKCLFGVFITGIILMMLVGPLYFFSDYGGFIAPNPVNNGDIKLSFIVDKTMSISDLEDGQSMLGIAQEEFGVNHLDSEENEFFKGEESMLNLAQDPTSNKLNKKVPYMIYENQNPFFRQYDDEYYAETKFNRWTETRFFTADQLQS